MQLRTLSVDSGLRILAELRAGTQLDVDTLLGSHPTLHEPSDQALSALKADAMAALTEYTSETYGKAWKDQLDAAVAEAVHRHLRLPPAVIGCREFWIRLSLVECPSLLRTRFSTDADPLGGDANYGVETMRNGYLFRSWLRGDIGFEPGAQDPYHVARLAGDVDFWVSHVLRVNYGGCRTFARTFIRMAMDPGYAHHIDMNRLTKREVAKVVHRRHSVAPLEIYSEEEAVRLVSQAVEVAARKLARTT